MKRFIIPLLVFVVLMVSISNIRADESFTYCIDTSVDWLRFTVTANVEDTYAQGYVKTFSVDAVDSGVTEIYLGANWYTLTAGGSTGACGADDAVWHAGAATVNVVLTSDCANVVIYNGDGGSSLVTDVYGTPIVLHYGETLFVDPNGDTDANDYTAVPIACS